MLRSHVGMNGAMARPGAAVASVAPRHARAEPDIPARHDGTAPGRTALDHFRGDDLRRYEALWQQARRIRRHVPRRAGGASASGRDAEDTGAGDAARAAARGPRRDGASGTMGAPMGDMTDSPTREAMPPGDDVRIVALRPTLSIKTHYSTADVLDAFAAGARPFESLVEISADLYAHGAGEPDPERRDTFLRIGAILDALSGLDARTYAYRTALGVCRTASKLLRGGVIDANDLLDLSTMERVLATPDHAPSVAAKRTGAFRTGGVVGVRADARDGRERDPGLPGVNEGAPGAPAPGAPAPGVLAPDVSASGAPVPDVLAPDVSAPGAPRPGAADGAGVVDGRAVQGAPSRRQATADRPAPRANDLAASVPPPFVPPPFADEMVGAAEVARERVRLHLPLQRGDDPAALEPPRFAWRLNNDRERGSFEHADAAYDFVQGPARYTRVGNVPLLGRRLSDGRLAWESMPLPEYVAAVDVPATASQRFDVAGMPHIAIDGLAYRVREIEPGVPWIVHEHSGWPPLPLVRGADGTWALKPADLTAVDVDGPVGNDGFMRIAGRKFIRVDGKTVEVAKDVIFGEEAILPFARPGMGPLMPADAPGIVRDVDGVEWIEGRHGYYRLRRDGLEGRHYVGEEDGRRWVRFDASRKRWNVVPGKAEPEDAGGDAGAQREYRLAPVPHRESVRKDSSQSIDSLRRFQDRIGKIDFLQARPTLRTAIDEAFQGIVDLQVRRPNRLLPGGGDLSQVVSLRRKFFRTTYQKENWDRLTIGQKQRFVAEKVFNFYARGLYLTHLYSDALCHEMADFMTAQLMQSAALRKKILQIEFRELPGSGLGHAAVLYADDPALLNRFGRLDDTDPVRQHSRPRLDRAEFLAFMHANRNKLLLIDPWGLEKVIDLSAMDSAHASGVAIDVNLPAAGFGAGLNDHYRVAALLPELPKEKPGVDDTRWRASSLPSTPNRQGSTSLERRGGSQRMKRPNRDAA